MRRMKRSTFGCPASPEVSDAAGRPLDRYRPVSVEHPRASASVRSCVSRARPGFIGFSRPRCQRGATGRRITRSRVIPATPLHFRLRLGVLVRDRLVLPKQSAEPGTADGPFCATPARSLRPHPLPRMRHGRTGFSRPGTSPEVFVPFSTRWPRRVCPGRPASGPSRFDVSASHVPRLTGTSAWRSPVRFFPLCRTAAMVLDAGWTHAGGASGRIRRLRPRLSIGVRHGDG
jgi:hypothetical protein